MDTDADALRTQLVRLLDGVDARMTFDEAVAAFPEDAMNRRAPNVEYTPWHIIEHIRRTQADILEYVLGEGYTEKAWPDEYWPARDETATRELWDETIRGFQADLAALKALVRDPERDLFETLPDTPGHTLIREVRIVGDHNAYHVGEFAVLRQVMGTWPADHR
jgi:hypothetical protein